MKRKTKTLRAHRRSHVQVLADGFMKHAMFWGNAAREIRKQFGRCMEWENNVRKAEAYLTLAQNASPKVANINA